MQCVIKWKKPNQLTNCDETKKMVLNTQTVRAKEKTKLSHGGFLMHDDWGFNAYCNEFRKFNYAHDESVQMLDYIHHMTLKYFKMDLSYDTKILWND